MKKFFAFMVLALVGAASFTACSKDDDDETPMVASVSMVGKYDTLSYSLNYDGNRLVGITSGNQTTTIKYDGNVITAITKSKNYADTVIYKLENGKIATSSEGNDKYKYEYNGNQVSRIVQTAGSNSLDTVVFTWANGNIVKEAYSADDYIEYVATEYDNNMNVDLSAWLSDFFDGPAALLNITGARSNKLIIDKNETLSDAKKDEKGRLTGFVITYPDGTHTEKSTFVITYK